MTSCKSCGAPLLWATTARGKAMPLNPAPDPRGNVVLAPGGAIVLGPLELAADKRTRYMPHHATCPDAAEWKR